MSNNIKLMFFGIKYNLIEFGRYIIPVVKILFGIALSIIMFVVLVGLLNSVFGIEFNENGEISGEHQVLYAIIFIVNVMISAAASTIVWFIPNIYKRLIKDGEEYLKKDFKEL